jgi:hypothetical protein
MGTAFWQCGCQKSGLFPSVIGFLLIFLLGFLNGCREEPRAVAFGLGGLAIAASPLVKKSESPNVQPSRAAEKSIIKKDTIPEKGDAAQQRVNRYFTRVA